MTNIGSNQDRTKDFRRKIEEHLDKIYGTESAKIVITELVDLIKRYESVMPGTGNLQRWSEEDVILITYGDQIQKAGEAPLATLRSFLRKTKLTDAVSAVHILPFYPWSSDDGFSVKDYFAVDAQLGTWKDIDSLAEDCGIMADYVVNHASSEGEWFRKFLAGDQEYKDFFLSADPSLDYSQVLRPRSTPLLTPYETSAGIEHIWTTFSADQVDLNFSSTRVLVKMTEVLLFYISHGCRLIRLDAVNYLWKKIGTSCTHLPETHEIVKLLRTICDQVAPDVILVSETNVPHDDNISYFGDGDEAHVVYNFSLPPLLCEGVLSERADILTAWAKCASDLPDGNTFLNFCASHDGIGVRSFISFHEQGMVPTDRFEKLFNEVEKKGGKISARTKSDGTQGPYELNISLFDLLGDPESLSPEQHVKRFVMSQSVVMVLRGIPALYFHSFIGTRNYTAGMQETKRNRTLNRKKFDWDELFQMLEDGDAVYGRVFAEMKRLLLVRKQNAAFHPEAPQKVLDLGDEFFAVRRGEGSQALIAVANFSREKRAISLGEFGSRYEDIIDNSSTGRTSSIDFDGYQVRWLRVKD